MKLYVWQHCMDDYTQGIVVCLAPNKRKAWSMLKKEYEYAYYELRGVSHDGKALRGPRYGGRVEPEVYALDEPVIFSRAGGG